MTFRHRVYEYGWEPRAHKWGPEVATQLEVRLVDDDGDGIPDRGVIKVPADLSFGRGFPGYGPRFGRRFGPSTMLRTGPHFGWGFPFFIIGGLFRLAFLALLIGLGVACFRRWSRTRGERELQGG